MEFRREVWIRGIFLGIVSMEIGDKSVELNEISKEVSEGRTKEGQGLIHKALQVEKGIKKLNKKDIGKKHVVK